MAIQFSSSRRSTLAAFAAAGLVCVPISFLCAGSNSVVDEKGRRVVLRGSKRIACIGGTITETLYALGAADRIVGVDTSSTWPRRALIEKKSLGYMRAISSEGVLSLQPDLIVAMENAGPPTAIDQLIMSGIPVIFICATPSPKAMLERTHFLANLIGAREKGDALCAAIERGFRALADWHTKHKQARRVLFVLHMSNGHVLAAGAHTAADAIISLAGATNVAHRLEGYKLLSNEDVIALAPDIVVTMSQGASALRAALDQEPGFHLTPAGRNNAIISLDGEQLLGFGPRTPLAALHLAQLIDAVPG